MAESKMNHYEMLRLEFPDIYPSKMGAKWEDDDILQLLQMIQKKKTNIEIGESLQRTPGAIRAQRFKLAADYHYNDNRPLEQIQKFTGLTQEEVEAAIRNRAPKEKSASKSKNTPKCLIENDKPTPKDTKNQTEVIQLLTAIHGQLAELLQILKTRA